LGTRITSVKLQPAFADGLALAASTSLARGFRGADVRAHGNIHADITGNTRKCRTDQIADCHFPAEKGKGQREYDGACDRDGRVLPVEVGVGAFLDRAGDFLHACIAGGLRIDPAS
jgi:hypothetical protein